VTPFPRRVVTTVTDDGASVIAEDSTPPNSIVMTTAGNLMYSDVWVLTGRPGQEPEGDLPTGSMTVEPPAGGVTFRVLTLPPREALAGTDMAAVMAELAEKAPLWMSSGQNDPERAGFHRTRSTDFITVLAGELWLVVDDEETLLRAGDTVVQRGAWHAWENRSDEPVTMSVVMAGWPPSA
jgi:mannose-6-phosphate isomerase-like protein (cupin superfamily)